MRSLLAVMLTYLGGALVMMSADWKWAFPVAAIFVCSGAILAARTEVLLDRARKLNAVD